MAWAVYETCGTLFERRVARVSGEEHEEYGEAEIELWALRDGGRSGLLILEVV